ncbi:MAG TPA: hypothetical protein ACFCUY_12545 [Xenococcaceae cyanobacterium]
MMKALYFLPLLLGLSSLNLLAPNKSLSSASIAQLENITEVTTSVLDNLGYECETVSAAAIICRKCAEETNITEECTAYICDSVTKKCRKQKATVPNLPDSGGEPEEREDQTPSLPSL